MTPDPLIRKASTSTIGSLLDNVARAYPARVALRQGQHRVRFDDLSRRTNRLAHWLLRQGVGRGERIALLSENSIAYLEIVLAAAKAGAIVACQNWRLSERELAHCIGLVEPKLVLSSARYSDTASRLASAGADAIRVDEAFEAEWSALPETAPAVEVDAEDPLLILYTSGTTGLPKGAAISHRAEIARGVVLHADFDIAPDDTFVAWTPLYHMGGADLSLGTLLAGGTVIVCDGFDAPELAAIAAREPLGWLIVMPGTVERMIEALERQALAPVGVKVCGVMADLVPRREIARLTTLLDAPYANTFGSTETGSPPGSASPIAVGRVPAGLAKRQSPYCELRLVDASGRDVPVGEPGEALVRGPTLFSGYWRAEAANREDFRQGWFHMGDVLVRHPDGTLDFVDRAKYLIKSGGENIYPAEIERVLLATDGVVEAAVVRRRDRKWGEVPVAFVARRDEGLDAEALRRVCRAQLAGYKQPSAIHFIDAASFPRSASGKIQRHELERRLEADEA